MRADIKRAFEHLSASMSVDPPPQSIAEMIDLLRSTTESYGDVVPRAQLTGVRCIPVDASGVAAEWIVPDAPASNAITVYLHGGGWAAGSLNSHRSMIAAIAMATGMPVLSVGYRLSPENPYPAGLEDCVTALKWAETNAPEGLAKPTNIFLAGDSCGGNLTAATCLHLIEHGGRLPDKVVLISPMLEAACNPERQDREGDPVGSNAGVTCVPDIYGIDQERLADPLVSPVHAPVELLAKFPPTLIQASGAEFFYWDAKTFTDRLAAAGARVTLSLWPNMPHVWHLFANFLPEAKDATAEIAKFLR